MTQYIYFIGFLFQQEGAQSIAIMRLLYLPTLSVIVCTAI